MVKTSRSPSWTSSGSEYVAVSLSKLWYFETVLIHFGAGGGGSPGGVPS